MTHERSARVIGNIAEADAFASRIEKLRAKHNITETIELEEETETKSFDVVFGAESPLFKPKRILWEELLFHAICNFHECRAVFYRSTNLKFMYGEKDARDKCREDYLYLFEIAGKECAHFIESAKTIGEIDTREWKQSFLLGFAKGIEDRLYTIFFTREYVNRKKSETAAANTFKQLIESETPETALAISEKTVHRPPSEKQQKIEENLNNLKSSPTSITHVEGIPYRAGMQIAEACELSAQLALTEKNAHEEYRTARPQFFGIFSQIFATSTNSTKVVQPNFFE